MSFETDIYDVLSADPTLSGLVAARIYPVTLPLNEQTYPAVSYQRVGNASRKTLGDNVGFPNPRFQFDIWATGNHDAARQVADALITALGATSTFQAVFLDDSDVYEQELELYRIIADFSIW